MFQLFVFFYLKSEPETRYFWVEMEQASKLDIIVLEWFLCFFLLFVYATNRIIYLYKHSNTQMKPDELSGENLFIMNMTSLIITVESDNTLLQLWDWLYWVHWRYVQSNLYGNFFLLLSTTNYNYYEFQVLNEWYGKLTWKNVFPSHLPPLDGECWKCVPYLLYNLWVFGPNNNNLTLYYVINGWM